LKTIILHPDATARETIRRQLHRLDHVVVHEENSLDNIVSAVAKHRPHFVVAAEPEPFLRDCIELTFQEFALRVPICWHPTGAAGSGREDGLEAAISHRLNAGDVPTLTRYTDDHRQVTRDDGYKPFDGATKQNLPDDSDDPAKDLAREMEVFGRQVECALHHHAAARYYLRQALMTDRGLRVETAYRAVHSSHKIYWLREHVMRWVGVLAHYLSGVDPSYLPPPSPPSPKLDFLYYTPPPESYYAATAVLMHGFKPSWMSMLRSVLGMKFTGQDETSLLQETLNLTGWSGLLREIAVAQVRTMDCALRSDQPWYTQGLPPRRLHRATQTFCDFWHLRQLRTSPQNLRLIADWVVVDGVRSPGTLPVVPPFRHYVEGLVSNLNNEEQTKPLSENPQ